MYFSIVINNLSYENFIQEKDINANCQSILRVIISLAYKGEYLKH